MTNADTHTVETAYGTAEIKTYDCDSCGTTVPYDETVEFTIGDREGRACEICEDTGPIEFPVFERVVDEFKAYQWVFIGSFVAPLLIFSRFAEGPAEVEFTRGYTLGAASVFFWYVTPLLGVLWMLSEGML